MLLAKAPLWVKALAEHAMETARAIANKVFLANMMYANIISSSMSTTRYY